MKIVVSSNCQTGGVAATLRAIFPEYEIIPVPLPQKSNLKSYEDLKSLLVHADFWISGGCYELVSEFKLTLIKLPEIYFEAFHPDLVYANLVSNNNLVNPHYNSKIAIWAYNNNIEITDALSLFNGVVYKKLGYFDLWESSIKALYASFLEHQIESHQTKIFINRVKRRGNFMHSINHPHSAAIVELAKIVALKMGADPQRINREIFIPDGLQNTIWPIYPEIASELGLHGEYVWRCDNLELYGLESYLQFTFQTYKKNNYEPGDLKSFNMNERFHKILFEELNKK